MDKTNYIAVIVEGRFREPQIIENINNIFFSKQSIKLIHFPAEQNIYMLWKRLNEDDFETDIIELIREYSTDAEKILSGLTRNNFSEVYLFFDYDGQQTNLDTEENSISVLKQMIDTFDNETENGKLYISYPMVEALRDYIPHCCIPKTQCFWKVEDLNMYKTESGKNNCDVHFKKFTINEWKTIVNSFAIRVSCLFDENEVISFEKFRSEYTVESIFQRELVYIQNGVVFVLSAFPQFLLDYNKINFWKSCIKSTQIPLCDKKKNIEDT